jgi:endonuclease/exonuclease/phosphatase family metal-dependent hydrolase
MRTLIVGLSLLLASSVANATVLCSWNLKRLGHGETSYRVMSRVASLCDFVAVQEVMNEAALQRLQQSLGQWGGTWSSMASHAIGRGTYKEMYGFLWREEAIEYLDGAAVFLDSADTFAREPYSARFKTANGTRVVVANVHVLYGKNEDDRAPEVKALAEYWKWLREVYGRDAKNIAMFGDFNTKPTEAVWAPLKAMAKPSITSGASTLGLTTGRYANLYDNIWVDLQSELGVRSSGVIPYPQLFNAKNREGLDHKRAREFVSDHAPVFISIDGVSFDPMQHQRLDGAR